MADGTWERYETGELQPKEETRYKIGELGSHSNLFVPGQAKTVKHAPVAVGPVSVSVCGPQII